jgi:hypothetical protein
MHCVIMIERLQPGWTARVNTALILAASLVSAWAQGSPRTTFYDEAKTIIEEVRPTPSLARVDDFLAKLPKISESSPL